VSTKGPMRAVVGRRPLYTVRGGSREVGVEMLECGHTGRLRYMDEPLTLFRPRCGACASEGRWGPCVAVAPRATGEGE
jgi:hypothetical protein